MFKIVFINLRSERVGTWGRGLKEREGKEPTAPGIPRRSPIQVRTRCPTLCDPIDGSPPGSPVPGILQARILEGVAISFSRRSSQPMVQTCISHISCIAPAPFSASNPSTASVPGHLAPGSALAPGRRWDGEKNSLAPGGLGLNPASVSPSVQESAPSPCLLIRLVQRCSEFITSTREAAPVRSQHSVNICHYCCGCPDCCEGH